MKRTVPVRPGKYVLGDPIYSASQILMDTMHKEIPMAGGRYYSGKDFDTVTFHTMAGDGNFPDQFGNFYPVDIALISLVPYDYANTENLEGSVTIVEFLVPTKCYSENGILHFGKYQINTNYDEEE